MANQTKSVLKGYFETGDTPSQAQYADLIDSQLNLSETTAQTVVGSTIFTSAITASGNISSSGILTAEGLVISDDATITDDLTVNGNIDLEGDIDVNGITNLDVVDIDGAVDMASTLTIASHITASGDISSSNASTASFGSAMLTNLPTSKPTITGSLWLSGSADDGTSKYLLVFTG